jgi:hypothetical protein
MSKLTELLFRRVLPLIELKATKNGPQPDVVESSLSKVCVTTNPSDDGPQPHCIALSGFFFQWGLPSTVLWHGKNIIKPLTRTGTDGTRWFKLIQVHLGMCCALVITLTYPKGVDQMGMYARTADRTDGKRQAGFN